MTDDIICIQSQAKTTHIIMFSPIMITCEVHTHKLQNYNFKNKYELI